MQKQLSECSAAAKEANNLFTVVYVNAVQIMQQQVCGEDQPGHTPRRRHSQDTTQGCIPLEQTARGTVAGLCSGRDPLAQRD